MPSRPQVSVVRISKKEGPQHRFRWLLTWLGLFFAAGIVLGCRIGTIQSQHESILEDVRPVTSLVLEESESSAAMVPPREISAVSSPRLVTYTVQKGDTLSLIGERFNTSVDSIVSINKLQSPNNIQVGTNLTIIENASGTIRRVASGDTLWDIARVYGVSVEAIVSANNIEDPKDIKIGQLLIIPGADLSSTPVEIASVSRAGPLYWPVRGTITSAFGYRKHPITGRNDNHQAIDIAADSGTAVRAAASGTVTCANWQTGYGRLIIIDHGNGLETRYGHLSSWEVGEGHKVSTGDVIGYVGQTGSATGPHLHFEVRLNGTPKNPRSYLP
jgi:murein DD-endopeptidase MepM/ murein hydrolase activator NlpD